MVLQTTAGSRQAVPSSEDTRDDRRRHMIDALQELKNNIARIEQNHPRLGNDLSSTCDRAISELVEIPPLQSDFEAPETAMAVPQPNGENPLSQAVDKAGDGIIHGLERMGDGIIFVFAKIGRIFG